MRTNIQINLSALDQGDILRYVQNKYDPEDVFPQEELGAWARKHGFVEDEK